MSLHLEMLQAARLAPRHLGESTELVVRFLRDQQKEDGGFKDRTGRSDLYYTVFGLDGLLALALPKGKVEPWSSGLAKAANFLRSFPGQEELDFVHLCCLARGMGALRLALPSALDATCESQSEHLIQRIERFRSGDGGYHPVPGSEFGSAYGCFLAIGAYQDFQIDIPEPEGVLACLAGLRAADGGWANYRDLRVSGTNATVAAMRVLRQFQVSPGPEAVDWLLARAHAQGGFVAAPEAPLPDLLSTATALHALAGENAPLEGIREKSLDFVDTLWTNAGAFHGHWADDELDVEYTFYGLLALGHLV
jgi:prenyltransferase beta subunit